MDYPVPFNLDEFLAGGNATAWRAETQGALWAERRSPLVERRLPPCVEA